MSSPFVCLFGSAIAAMRRPGLLLFGFFFGRQFGFAEGADFLPNPSYSSKLLFAVGAFYRFSCSTRTKTHVRLPPVNFVAGGVVLPQMVMLQYLGGAFASRGHGALYRLLPRLCGFCCCFSRRAAWGNGIPWYARGMRYALFFRPPPLWLILLCLLARIRSSY